MATAAAASREMCPAASAAAVSVISVAVDLPGDGEGGRLDRGPGGLQVDPQREQVGLRHRPQVRRPELTERAVDRRERDPRRVRGQVGGLGHDHTLGRGSDTTLTSMGRETLYPQGFRSIHSLCSDSS